MREIYLDNSATTRVEPEIAQVALSLMTEDYGNPSSLHRKGLAAQLRLDRAREQLALGLDCTPREVVFTSGGTESNNLALLGGGMAGIRRGKTVVSTAVEHASVGAALRQLQTRGFTVKLAPPLPDGSIDPEAMAALVDEDTVLVSCMLVNSEMGALYPVDRLSRLVRRKNKQVLVHCDGVQALGKVPVSVSKLGVDLFSVSGHKLHAPKGCGALYIRRGARILPQVYGGSQERGLRAGTENTPLACAFGAAVATAVESLSANFQRVTELCEYFVKIGEQIPGVCMNSPGESTPYIRSLSVPGYRSEILLHFLETRGIYVSSGSACSKGARSHVLTAMGLPADRVDSALRVSFSRHSTREEVDAFWQALGEGMASLARR